MDKEKRDQSIRALNREGKRNNTIYKRVERNQTLLLKNHPLGKKQNLRKNYPTLGQKKLNEWDKPTNNKGDG